VIAWGGVGENVSDDMLVCVGVCCRKHHLKRNLVEHRNRFSSIIGSTAVAVKGHSGSIHLRLSPVKTDIEPAKSRKVFTAELVESIGRALILEVRFVDR
jgi:hypothetical protein